MSNDEVRRRALNADSYHLIEIIACVAFSGLDMHCACLLIVYLFVLEEAMWRSGYDLAQMSEEISLGFGLGCCFPLSWLGPKRWRLLLPKVMGERC